MLSALCARPGPAPDRAEFVLLHFERAAGPDAFFDAIEMLSVDSLERLALYAKGGFTDDPQLGFWTVQDLARRNA